jgi:hypothetical protein
LRYPFPVPEPWPVILVPAQSHLGEHSFYAPFLVPRPLPSLSARFHDRSKRHMTCWQSLLSRASSLQFNWNAHSFLSTASINRCFFDPINIDNSLLPAHPPGEFCWQPAASSTTGTVCRNYSAMGTRPTVSLRTTSNRCPSLLLGLG